MPLTSDELRRRVAALQTEAAELRKQFSSEIVRVSPRVSKARLAELFADYLEAGDRLQTAVEQLQEVNDQDRP